MVYLLEDDESIRQLVVYTLNQQKIETKGFSLPSEFYKEMEKNLPDVIILDIMLPEENGLEILKKLKKNDKTKQIHIMMLTAKTTEYDRIIGLDIGADDYMCKPFSIMELVSRVNAMLRRAKPENSKNLESFTKFKDLEIDFEKYTVKVCSEEINLTKKEYQLLEIMIKNPDIVFTRQKLLEKIWGYDYEGETRTVDVHIKTLRQKLKKCSNYIQTVHGIGYKIGVTDDKKNI